MNKQTIRLGNEAYFALVRQRLDAGDDVRIPVVGKSMEPFLRERDEVLLQAAAFEDVRMGDIVLAVWKGGYVLHRVIRIKDGWLWLAGDNNLAQIEKIAPGGLIARVCEAHRGDEQLTLTRPRNRKLGLLWYQLRFPRRVAVWLKRQVARVFRKMT